MLRAVTPLSILASTLLFAAAALAAEKAPPPADWEFSPDNAVKRSAELMAYLDQYGKESKERAKAAFELPDKLASKKAEPAWVKKGSWIDKAGGKELRFAVGVISGVQNPALAVNTAANRARAELGKLTSGVKVEEKKSADGSKSVTTTSSSTLSGVIIVDYYLGANSTWYALAMQAGG